MYGVCMKDKLATFGLVGAALAALCCFTPLLPLLLPAVGLGGIVSYIYNDFVLLPALAVFLIISAYGLWWNKSA